MYTVYFVFCSVVNSFLVNYFQNFY